MSKGKDGARGSSDKPKSAAVPAGPVLTDATGMGGVNAQDGFDYQIWDGLARLPGWMRLQSFEGLMFEGLEDLEARFFAPHAPHGHFLDRWQAKSGELSRADVIDVFESFSRFHKRHPNVARVQTLVTPTLPSTLRWIGRDPVRVRNARPFYDPFPLVMVDSDAKVRSDLIKELGQDLGKFAANSVDVSSRITPDRSTAVSLFGSEMSKAFPEVQVPQKRIADAFSSLSDLASSSRGKMISRQELVTTIEQALGTSLGLPAELHLHIRSDRTSPCTTAIEIDGSPFSGGGGVPPSREWKERLQQPLTATANWAHSAGYRRVQLSGQFRLSPAIAIGWAFRSATGFELLIPTKSGVWETDSHPTPGSSATPCTITDTSGLCSGRLIVAIGVMRDPTPAVRQLLNLASNDCILTIDVPQAVSDPVMAQQLVQSVKSSVLAATTRLGAQAIDLFFVGPAALAVAIGHRWNAMPPTQVFEYDPASHQYSPSVLL